MVVLLAVSKKHSNLYMCLKSILGNLFQGDQLENVGAALPIFLLNTVLHSNRHRLPSHHTHIHHNNHCLRGQW